MTTADQLHETNIHVENRKKNSWWTKMFQSDSFRPRICNVLCLWSSQWVSWRRKQIKLRITWRLELSSDSQNTGDFKWLNGADLSSVFVTLRLMVWILGLTVNWCLDREPDWTSRTVSLKPVRDFYSETFCHLLASNPQTIIKISRFEFSCF